MARPDVQAFLQWQQAMQGDPKMKAILDAIRQGGRPTPPGGTPTFPPQAGNTFYDVPKPKLLGSGSPGGNLPQPVGPQGMQGANMKLPVIDGQVMPDSPPRALGGAPEQKLLSGAVKGGRLKNVLGMLGRGAGAAMTGATAYGMAKELTGPKNASLLGGPGMQMAELANSMVNDYGNDTSSLPKAPQGPGLPMNPSSMAPYGPREEMTPEFAQQLIQSLKTRGGSGRTGGQGQKNPFTFNDPTEMGPEVPEEMAETVDGFPEELRERQPMQFDTNALQGIQPGLGQQDPSLALAAKKNKGNPLMRAIMAAGRGLGKVF